MYLFQVSKQSFMNQFDLAVLVLAYLLAIFEISHLLES
jgi:hypothetical protein